MMKIKRKNRLSKVLFPIVSLALIAGGWFVYQNYFASDYDTRGDDGINYSPATDDDKKDNDQKKQDIVSGNDSGNTASPVNSSDKIKVTPVISAWGQPDGAGTDFKLNGYVAEVIESDGECTLTLTNGSDGVSVNKRALQDAKLTSCGQLSVPFDKLYPGDWKAVLSYSSSKSAGESVETLVEVQ